MIVLKLISRWYYFMIAAVIVFPIAYGYVKYADKKYHVQGSLLLRKEEQNDLGGKGFLKGMELFATKTALEDEIGILRSHTMVAQAIHELDFGISYFARRRLRTREMYHDSPFRIVLDSTANQVVNASVFIEPLDSNRYRVEVHGQELDAYNFLTGQIEEHFEEVDLIADAEEGEKFESPFLRFTLFYDSTYRPVVNERYFFVVHDLDALAEHYQSNLNVMPISRESNIVQLSMQHKVPHKAVAFLNKLLDVYLKNELNKKNQLGLKTIMFIDSQLSGVSDSLRQVEGSLEDFRVKSNIRDINVTAETLSKNLDKLETEKADLGVKLK